jgi:hypothetical protein
MALGFMIWLLGPRFPSRLGTALQNTEKLLSRTLVEGESDVR